MTSVPPTQFLLGSTEFGVEHDRTTSILLAENGAALFTLEVRGDPAKFAEASEGEDSPWFWALYPPHLYLRNLPLRSRDGVLEGSFCSDELIEEYEAGLYMMEHYDLGQLAIRIDASGQCDVRGTVELAGDVVSLVLNLTLEPRP